MNRREFFIGSGACVASAVAGVAIAPVGATALRRIVLWESFPPADLLVTHIEYQSWPFDEPRPANNFYAGNTMAKRPTPLSKMLKEHHLYWRVVA